MVSWAERLNQNYSKVGNQAVLATADFPWAEGIEREWRAVRAELDRLSTHKDELSAFHEIIGEVGAISSDDEQNTILRVQVGSGLHGVTVAANDDRDEMGVCIEPADCVIVALRPTGRTPDTGMVTLGDAVAALAEHPVEPIADAHF
jgi:hypothetical protein